MHQVLRSLGRWRPPIWLSAVAATGLLIGVVAFPAALVEFLVTIVQLAILAVAFAVTLQVGRWLLNRGGTDASSVQATQVIDRALPPSRGSGADADQTRVMPTDPGPTRRIDW